jgi:hypothetical protein
VTRLLAAGGAVLFLLGGFVGFLLPAALSPATYGYDQDAYNAGFDHLTWSGFALGTTGAALLSIAYFRWRRRG